MERRSDSRDFCANGIKKDKPLKIAAAYHKNLFLTSAQALIHGDLHTGSVMAKEGSTYIIDPEFAFYGPIGFDTGAFLANLFLNYFSTGATNDMDYGSWVLEQVITFYETFESTFLSLWNDSTSANELFQKDVYRGSEVSSAQQAYLSTIWRDTLGFTGMKMIRRIVGIAHVADLDEIADLDKRSLCEKRSLIFARKLVLHSYKNSHIADGLSTINDVVEKLAKPIYTMNPGMY